MKPFLLLRASFVVAIIFLAANFQLRAQTNSPDITPTAVLAVMQRVADWQIPHSSVTRQTDWVQAAGDVGIMALAGISGDPKYRDAMRARGETNHWKMPTYGGHWYHADDQCTGQVWAELYFLYRDPAMIAPMRERFDFILANPSAAGTNLDMNQPQKKALELWSWCDALFMAPPAWIRLYAATGDERYLNFAVTNWWRTTDYLYDKDEHLFFRDSTYFNKREANGKKVFWSRGNGWVFAGLVRMLQFLPTNHPDRPRFEQLFKDMAAKILTCQQADGLWRASLLDPESYPLKETSGSGFYTYGFAWGVNQGLLDRATYEPAMRRAWTALVGCVDADGKLTHVQPVGADPKKFADDSTAPYGVGAFLLAGSEIYRMAVLEKKFVNRSPWTSSGKNPKGRVIVTVKNPAPFARNSETVEINLNDTATEIPLGLSTGQFVVMDGISSRVLDSQIYSPQLRTPTLLFQVDLAPGETRTFYILDASALAALPPPIVKTFARYVPERLDDFAWESDRTAHRVYGQAVIKGEGLISSGVDVWVKSTRDLVINKWYENGDYHNDHGEGMDDYRVGRSRGGGGLGIWDGKKLFNSGNWRNYKIITTGPIRSEFELTYDAWDADGRKISETKRISIDAGSNMSRSESIFSSDDNAPLEIGVGLAQRMGSNLKVIWPDKIPDDFDRSGGGIVTQSQKDGWQTYWQPADRDRGNIATAIVLPTGIKEFFTETNSLPVLTQAEISKPSDEGLPAVANQLATTSAQVGKPFVYYFGAGWSKSGDFPNPESWNNYVSRFAERLKEPLQVTIGN